VKFTDLFVKRPVLAIVVNLVILIAGLQSVRALSVRQYPRSDIAVVKVTTAYIGANADLVRGFITTPLERVIASADGIDYMESSSAQGLSTITVHLHLNYDTNAALTQIQAKVAQVRNDLPPEAEAPVIELELADNQFAAIYLSFSSPGLDQNQITDYLMRVVQPKLSAVSGCSAPTFSATAPLPCASGSSPSGWRRTTFLPRQCGTRWRATTTCQRSGGPRDRWCR
jgi:multidrug efflux pump